MNFRTSIIIGFVGILFVCVSFRVGMWNGEREERTEWCAHYMGTTDLSECADLDAMYPRM